MGSSRQQILSELREVEKDLYIFKKMRSILMNRLNESMPEYHRKMLLDWPTKKVVDNGLIMAIVKCEGLFEEFMQILENMDLPNNVIKIGEKE